MNKYSLLGFMCACVFSLAGAIANADVRPLEGRLPYTQGGTDYQAYYDPNLDITWAHGTFTFGLRSWSEQMAWVAGLSIGGVSGWRLPNADVNGDGSVVDCFGGGVSGCTDNEMGFLYWEEGITNATPTPFHFVSLYYYSSTVYIGPPGGVWEFHFIDGSQMITSVVNVKPYAWAVHDGDVGAPIPALAASFTPLGDLPGGDFNSTAHGVSADGSVVVGTSDSASGLEAFRWTSEGGMVGLGDLPGGRFESRAFGVSADGSVVVGDSDSASGSEAFRWTSEGGMVGLGDLPGGDFDAFESIATDVSADGSVVVGYSAVASDREAFRWTSEGGMVGLGDLPGGRFESRAYGVSDDGSVVVGTSDSASGSEAFRWTSEDGMEGLGTLPDYDHSFAIDVSDDGLVVVGTGSASGSEAFRWTSEGGMVGLGALPGGDFHSLARGVSTDGSVVVGSSHDEAFRWTSEDGMQSVASILTIAGVDLTGWSPSMAEEVSADGHTIVGRGGNPDGLTEAWIATLFTFFDVPPGHWAFSHIETIAASGITKGCGNNNYCPEFSVTRAQMAVFLERSMRGGDFQPDPGAGNVFLDVPSDYWAGGWIELLYGDGITAGCGVEIYCPEDVVTREQMAVFLLRAKHGQDYVPPTPTGMFNDVDLNHWAAPWIEQLANEGITTGCGPDIYCPKDAVTRAQMAVFLVRTFDL